MTCSGCGEPIADDEPTIMWERTAFDGRNDDCYWHERCAPHVTPSEFIAGRWGHR